jgi:hypothetical protein
MVAADNGLLKADGLKRTNVADPAADSHQITGAKRRDVLSRTGKYESAGANLREAAIPEASGKFAGQLLHCRRPARVSRPAPKIKLRGVFIEQT